MAFYPVLQNICDKKLIGQVALCQLCADIKSVDLGERMKIMTAEVINGKDLAADLKADMKEEVAQLQERGIVPKLTVVLVGADPASQSYVNGKKKACKETGISSDVIELKASISEQELLKLIDQLNRD